MVWAFGGTAGSRGKQRVCAGAQFFYEFAERFAPELLAGAMEDYWSPIVLRAAKNELRTEVAGLFRTEDVGEDPEHPVSTLNVAGMLRAFYLATRKSSPLYGFTNPAHSAAERRNDRIIVRGAEADIKAIVRRLYKRELTPLFSCSTPATGSLSPACSKATASPAPAAGLRVWVVISQALPISAAPNTRWPSAYAY